MGSVARDVVLAEGPDAESFLQGQLSQDVAALAVGGSALSFLLQPQGKVDALLRVVRDGPERFSLDVDAGFGEAVLARLSRFKLRVKCELTLSTGVELPAPWGDGDRVASRWPAMGAELDERTIPAETGLVDRAVSFTKGCFTGQELVARIDSRGGNVPRHLRLLSLAAPAPVGAVVEVDGRERGSITSLSDDGAALALAYVHRDVVPPVTVVVRWDGGQTTAEVA
jgi:folate-binding protein YgfZ